MGKLLWQSIPDLETGPEQDVHKHDIYIEVQRLNTVLKCHVKKDENTLRPKLVQFQPIKQNKHPLQYDHIVS